MLVGHVKDIQQPDRRLAVHLSMDCSAHYALILYQIVYEAIGTWSELFSAVLGGSAIIKTISITCISVEKNDGTCADR